MDWPNSGDFNVHRDRTADLGVKTDAKPTADDHRDREGGRAKSSAIIAEQHAAGRDREALPAPARRRRRLLAASSTSSTSTRRSTRSSTRCSSIHGVRVVVDKRSLLYLDGVTVDFHDDLNKRGFSITNPHAKSTCGCGSSFSM